MALLLGLTGCGEDNQSNSIKTDTQPIVSNQREALNSQNPIQSSRSAIAPSLRGWTVNSTSPLGSRLIIDAEKLGVSSSALIKPTPADVAKVLRGGAAGIALSIAVDQLLGAVDWVLDPANNRIRYKELNTCTSTNECGDFSYYLYRRTPTVTTYFTSVSPACRAVASSYNQTLVRVDNYYDSQGRINGAMCRTKRDDGSEDQWSLDVVANPVYDPAKPEKTLPLETVAEQVISNADADSLEAQVATGLAAQSILNEAYNDDAKAEPIANELDNNANKNCTKHEIKMDTQAALVEWRYEKMYLDEHKLYQNHYEVSNPLILNGVNKGSWLGHVSQYQYAQGILKKYIKNANDDNCPATPKADYWKDKAPPPEPGVHSLG